jgi:hypothetical protein
VIPDQTAFDKTCHDLKHGIPLNLSMIGRIFGQDFWELLILVQTNIDLTAKGKVNVNIILPKGE